MEEELPSFNSSTTGDINGTEMEEELPSFNNGSSSSINITSSATVKRR
jgi:hypothetical protein